MMGSLQVVSAILAAVWVLVALGCWRTKRVEPARVATLVAVTQAAATVWPAAVPVAMASWLVGGLALPTGQLTTWLRRSLAGVGLAGGAAWSVWLLVTDGSVNVGWTLAAAALVGLVSLVAVAWRCSRATIDRRRALQWVAAAAVAMAAADAVMGALHLLFGAPADLLTWLVAALVLLPLGVLLGEQPRTARYAEWALVEAIVASGLAFLVVGVYLVVVLGLGRMPVEGERDILAASVIAALASAVLALPARVRLSAFGRSLLRRTEAPPEEALASFGARMTRAIPFDELLLQLAESLHATLGPAGAEVWVGSDGVLQRTVSVPDRPADRMRLSDRERIVLGRTRIAGSSWLAVWLPAFLANQDANAPIRVAPVAHLGELLGLLVVRRPAGAELYDEDEDRVLVELARQVGLALHNMRLDTALQASLEEVRKRNEELQASRLRIVTAADNSRREIERNLHDGAQQHLVALSVKLGLAGQLIDEDRAAVAELLEELRTDVQATVAALRELAHGIYPPLLRNHGLEQALQAATRRAALPCAVSVELPGRYPEEIEAAVYFCCLEAIQNAGKHAGPDATITVQVGANESTLRFSVGDNGRGFDPDASRSGAGFVNMADRLGAIGGKLSVESTVDKGTCVAGEIPATPVAAPAVSA
jgi:signal transduction histidine kinase